MGWVCGELSYGEQAEGWLAFINGGDYSDGDSALLVAALMGAQVEAFEALLPEGCVWRHWQGEIVGPVDARIEDALEAVRSGRQEDLLGDVMADICERIAERFDDIERAALGR